MFRSMHSAAGESGMPQANATSEIVRIAGAGPAGLAAAIHLARAGVKTCVYEKRPAAGRRFHGDLQGLENWSGEGDAPDVLDELARFGIPRNFDCDPFQNVLVTDGANAARAEFASPLFYLVKRGDVPGSLDAGLLASAREAGVEFRFGTRLDSRDAHIVATGVDSREIYAAAAGFVFRTNFPDTAAALVHPEAAPRGYAYLLISGGYGCVCTCLFEHTERAQAALQETCRHFRRVYGFDLKRDAHTITRMGGVVSLSAETRFAEEGRLFVGEAAGMQDFLWGFGMRHALVSGVLAARSLLEPELDYASGMRARFRPMLRAGLVNRFLWERSGRDAFAYVLRQLERQKEPGRTLHNAYGFRMFVQRLLYPLAAWSMRRRYPQIYRAARRTRVDQKRI